MCHFMCSLGVVLRAGTTSDWSFSSIWMLCSSTQTIALLHALLPTVSSPCECRIPSTKGSKRFIFVCLRLLFRLCIKSTKVSSWSFWSFWLSGVATQPKFDTSRQNAVHKPKNECCFVKMVVCSILRISSIIPANAPKRLCRVVGKR